MQGQPKSVCALMDVLDGLVERLHGRASHNLRQKISTTLELVKESYLDYHMEPDDHYSLHLDCQLLQAAFVMGWYHR